MSRRERKIIINNRPVFLARLAELLHEGYTFSESINLILPHHTKAYLEVLKEVDDAFKEGLGASSVLEKLGFSQTILLSMMIAERNGQLVQVLHSSAERLIKIEEAKKRFKNIVAYPIALFIFISSLLIGFRYFFLPNMEALSHSRQAEGVFVNTLLPNIVSMLPDFIIGTTVLLGIIVIVTLHLYRKQLPENKIRFIKRFPYIGRLVFQWKSQRFSGELGSLLESGIVIQDALDVLANQSVDVLLSEISKSVKKHLVYGEPFHEAVGLTDGLTKEFSSFAKHGEASGHLAKELLIYSTHLEETLYGKMMKGLSLLQPALFSLIALCILAAYLALLLPIYQMIDTI